ncbi:MAG: type II toxin-antitoxin system VapC family toxin [Deinococcota bacterium]
MYLLDTNTCIFIINRRPAQVRHKFTEIQLHELAISSITLFELDFGARKSTKVEDNLAQLDRFTSLVTVLPFDATAAQEAGRLRHYLRQQGTPIGDMDTLIAAHGLSVRATVVTNNTREFERVPDLVVEDWLV